MWHRVDKEAKPALASPNIFCSKTGPVLFQFYFKLRALQGGLRPSRDVTVASISLDEVTSYNDVILSTTDTAATLEVYVSAV